MAADPHRKTILIVDDIPANIKILGQAMRAGYEVMVATSGAKALQIAGAAEPPDLILLDIMMPEMDGYEVCRRLKEDTGTRDIPVIFITARDEEADETRGLALGAADYITKPFSVPIVMARVKNHLALKEAKESVDRAYARIEGEINLVASLQRSLLPREDVPVDGYSVASLYKPSGKASGDYFDYFYVDDDILRVIMADVSGHGPRAAFLMGIVRTLFRLTETEYRPLPMTLQLINGHILELAGTEGDFVTVFAVDLNRVSGELHYVNAGHCPGIIKTGGEILQLESTTMPLGMVADTFDQQTLQVGDSELFLFTDGFYEWQLPGGGLFGLERFTDMISRLLLEDILVVSELEKRLSADVGGQLIIDDDLTALYIYAAREESR